MDVARENAIVLVVPVYEVESSGVFYSTAADRTTRRSTSYPTT
jgi:hypothetical protein